MLSEFPHFLDGHGVFQSIHHPFIVRVDASITPLHALGVCGLGGFAAVGAGVLW